LPRTSRSDSTARRRRSAERGGAEGARRGRGRRGSGCSGLCGAALGVRRAAGLGRDPGRGDFVLSARRLQHGGTQATRGNAEDPQTPAPGARPGVGGRFPGPAPGTRSGRCGGSLAAPERTTSPVPTSWRRLHPRSRSPAVSSPGHGPQIRAGDCASPPSSGDCVATLFERGKKERFSRKAPRISAWINKAGSQTTSTFSQCSLVNLGVQNREYTFSPYVFVSPLTPVSFSGRSKTNDPKLTVPLCTCCTKGCFNAFLKITVL
jgi:hypothetical protein